MTGHWRPVEVLVVCCMVFILGTQVERLIERHQHEGMVKRQMPFIPMANRWQVFVARPGEAEFSGDVTLGKTWADAISNLRADDPPMTSKGGWTGPHWRVVDCRNPVDYGEVFCNAVYR